MSMLTCFQSDDAAALWTCTGLHMLLIDSVVSQFTSLLSCTAPVTDFTLLLQLA